MKARKAFEAEGIDRAVMRSRRGSAVRALQRARPAHPRTAGSQTDVRGLLKFFGFVAKETKSKFNFSPVNKLTD